MHHPKPHQIIAATSAQGGPAGYAKLMVPCNATASSESKLNSTRKNVPRPAIGYMRRRRTSNTNVVAMAGRLTIRTNSAMMWRGFEKSGGDAVISSATICADEGEGTRAMAHAPSSHSGDRDSLLVCCQCFMTALLYRIVVVAAAWVVEAEETTAAPKVAAGVE